MKIIRRCRYFNLKLKFVPFLNFNIYQTSNIDVRMDKLIELNDSRSFPRIQFPEWTVPYIEFSLNNCSPNFSPRIPSAQIDKVPN